MPQSVEAMSTPMPTPQVTADDVINFLNTLETEEEENETLEELDFS